MGIKISLFSLAAVVLISCVVKDQESDTVSDTITEKDKLVIPEFDSEYIANTFDYPVGKPPGNGYYIAQKFQENAHLGEDWNAVTGGNSDLGDPIYAIANGYVVYAEDYGNNWGFVIRIIHKTVDGSLVESLYAHCDTIVVKQNEWIKKGQKIGTIGTGNGVYLAHLHFELRSDVNLPIGVGYSNTTEGYLNPSEFIEEHQ